MYPSSSRGLSMRPLARASTHPSRAGARDAGRAQTRAHPPGAAAGRTARARAASRFVSRTRSAHEADRRAQRRAPAEPAGGGDARLLALVLHPPVRVDRETASAGKVVLRVLLGEMRAHQHGLVRRGGSPRFRGRAEACRAGGMSFRRPASSSRGKTANRKTVGARPPALSATESVRVRERDRFVREAINRASSAGGADRQAKQSDLATLAILGDGDFSEWFRISRRPGVGGSAGLERARGDSTILGGWTANCACEKKQQNRRSGRERRSRAAFAREGAASRRVNVPQDRLRAGRTCATRSETPRTRRPT